MGANIILISLMLIATVGFIYFKYKDWKEARYAKGNKES